MDGKEQPGEAKQDECLASSRSRRQLGDRHGRKAAIQKLRGLKGSKNKYQIGEVTNVYEEVSEDVYAKRRQARLEEDWIVDDDGSGYVEDGREIFDEGEEDELFISKKQGGGKRKSKQKSSSCKPGSGNIRSMLANMPTKKRKIEPTVRLDQDDVLGDILQDLDEKLDTPIAPKPTFLKKLPMVSPMLKSRFSTTQNFKRPFVLPVSKSTVTFKSSDVSQNILQIDVESPSQKIEEFESQNDSFEDDLITSDIFDDFHDQDMKIDEKETKSEEASMKCDPDKSEEKENLPAPQPVLEEKPSNRGFIMEVPCRKPVLGNAWETVNQTSENSSKVPEIHIDTSELPLITKENGEQVLRFFWLDAFEDYFNHPGTVYLFGKVWIESAQTYVSCCVSVKNIERRIFLLPRLKKINKQTGEETEDVKMMDVYDEFNNAFARKNKILQFKCRQILKNYAFEKVDIPHEAEYFEMRYSAEYPAPKLDFSGETFSHAFGTNTSSLELLLLDAKIKGPCWLDIGFVHAASARVSWCKIEAVAPNSEFISPVCGIPTPPVTVMTMNMRTKINPKSHQNEIVLVSCLVHSEFPLDKSSPQPPFQSHFCVLTRPLDVPWPWDLKTKLQSYGGTKVEKCESERCLLGFLLAKIQQIDPDVIIGYDIFGIDLGVLLHRIQSNKIPHWSRIGRLKRIQMPKLNNKAYAEKMAVSGRLICDVKISAKELIQAKSYDLGPLITQVLKVPESDRVDLTPDQIKKMFEEANTILKLINTTMQDASYILRLATELNILPLALQITNIAGNVMSRTLLGGRSERNEFLLLHAFTDKNYICPDKLFGKAASKVAVGNAEDEPDDTTKAAKGGKRKPAYAGGLVLDPKRGFYDSFILLMDFNSLYPSIIQEYNICFTTINQRNSSKGEIANEEDDLLLDMPNTDSKPGVLPTEIRKLVESRREVKKLMKQTDISADLWQQYDIRQKALKLTANSMYGCLGFSFSRFYARHLAALVTAKGREILLNTKDLVNKMNFDVIYGDTDSLMINTNSKDYEEVFRLGHKIKHEVNKMYKLLELDVDGVFKYMLLLKKKKYAAVTVTKLPNGELVEQKELKGLDIVRRDWCQLSADTGRNILDQILSNQEPDERIENIHSLLEKCKEDLESGKVKLDLLVITKQLTKNPEDYPDKNVLPHVQVALRVNLNGEKKLRQGDTVPYVICEDGSNLSATQRAYHIDEVKANTNLKVDYHYYLSQQMHPVISRLCDPIQGTDAARIAEVLGLDPSNYRSNKQYNQDEEDFASTEVSDEEKYRMCERFSFKCLDCQTLITVDSPTRGSGSSTAFILESCPNPKCNNSPCNNTSYILNKIRMDIRRHISTYYNGWLVCEDPSCNTKTRRISLQFSRGFPICFVCQRSTLFKEYTESQLYKQLCFYEYIFDFQKGCQKNKELRNKTEAVKKLYFLLLNEVRRHLKLNSYSSVNLGHLFSCLYVKHK